MSDGEVVIRLVIALAVGLVIGFERGWHDREAPEGTRVAGVRTFALIGLVGGLAAVLGTLFSVAVAAAITLGTVGFVWILRALAPPAADIGATTEVATIATFALGLLAGLGHLVPAIAGAAATAFLLGIKGPLHAWLRAIDARELFAALQLLVISAVFLPLLPDVGLGPYAAFNPYRIWWMVVLVAGLSFTGYVAMRLLGAQAGALAAGALGGLVASTATTLTLARRAKEMDSKAHHALAAGVIAACTVMVVRMGVLAAVVFPPLLAPLLVPFGAATAVGAAATLWHWHAREKATLPAPTVGNPLDLRTAFAFGALLAIILVAAEALKQWGGAAGLYALAAASGLADVDAVTLALATLATQDLAPRVAVTGIAVAAAVNTAVKGVLAWIVGPPGLARAVAAALVLMLAAGSLGLVLAPVRLGVTVPATMLSMCDPASDEIGAVDRLIASC